MLLLLQKECPCKAYERIHRPVHYFAPLYPQSLVHIKALF